MRVGVCLGVTSLQPMTTILTSVTWNGTALTKDADSEADDNNFEGVCWFDLDDPAAGTFNLVVNVNAASQVGVIFVTFTETGLTVGAASVATGTSADPSVTCADSQNGDIVFAIMANDGSASLNGQSGTDIGSAYVGNDSRFAGQYTTASGANTVMSWTMGDPDASWALSAVAIRGVGGGTTQNLAGAATAAAIAAAQLAITKAMASSAVAQGTAAADLAVLKSLLGAAAAQAQAGGALDLAKLLAGAATAQGAAAGQLLAGGTIVTPPLKNNTGTVLAGESGATAHIYTLAGALVVTRTDLNSNGAGVITISDALLAAGTTYRVVIVLASGAEGMDKIAAV